MATGQMTADPLQLDDVIGRRWSVERLAEGVRFRLADGAQTCDVPLGAMDKRVGLMASITSALLLRLATDDKKVMFRLSDPQFTALGGIFGLGRMTRMAVRSFSWIAILVGVVWILGSLPAPAVPEEGIEAIPLSLFTLAWGVTILIAGIAGRIVSHRAIVLVDAMWCFVAAGDSVLDIINARSSVWWGIAAVALVGLGLSQLRMFRLLRPG